jgi:murein DD-endopeptidase MepM/ murein hydrolase activator NlpD
MADGTYFFYAHFSEFAPGIEIGTKVVPGQIIGFNGATGNASVPHLHFEIHPGGGAAINPFPIVKAIDGCSRTEPLPQPGGAAPPQPGWSVAAASQPAATTTP